METNELQNTEAQTTQETVVAKAETTEGQAAENTETSPEADPSHPNHHHHTNALLAASLGHSAVNHVRPHHSTRLDN